MTKVKTKRKYTIHNKCDFIGRVKQFSGKSLKELRKDKQTEYLKNPENRVVHNFNTNPNYTFKIKKKEINKLLLECMVLNYNLHDYIRRN
jgi:hypothetical protein